MHPARTMDRGERDRDGVSDAARLVPHGLVALGALALVALVAEWLAFGMLDGTTAPRQLVGEFLISLALAAALAYGGYWITTRDYSVDLYPRIARWCLCGLLGFLLFNLLIMMISPAPTPRANVAWARGTAVLGAFGGLLLGIVEARSIQRARRAERAVARAEYAERQQQWFDYLNGLLRHEVLNKANVIEGYAALVAEDVDDPVLRERLDVIRRNSDEMAEVIEDVRVLIHATEEPDELSAVDLVPIVRNAIADVRDRTERVHVEADLPSDAPVSADALLPRVFSNLLDNAVEHSDTGDVAIDVTIDEHPDEVLVTVSDDGPGIPDDERSSLFERSDNTGSTHGLGLYLVRHLVDRYDGDVALTETGPGGTTFTVALPRADTANDGDAPDESPLR
ncbi:sensor histidine kinase [Halarchaeum nitratireducens]|nr:MULTISPECIES: HAMP domain-containing sensor histidine kinase [Halarchaeum]MBP2252177.1 signal transduction histidine kinase [Halarchaeum solikamskense]